jgi:hypothetical protein
MWFGLILERLGHDYYRSTNQVLADIDLIASNAASYNGPQHEIAIDAKEVVNKIKLDLLKCFDKLGDSFIKHRIDLAK